MRHRRARRGRSGSRTALTAAWLRPPPWAGAPAATHAAQLCARTRRRRPAGAGRPADGRVYAWAPHGSSQGEEWRMSRPARAARRRRGLRRPGRRGARCRAGRAPATASSPPPASRGSPCSAPRSSCPDVPLAPAGRGRPPAPTSSCSPSPTTCSPAWSAASPPPGASGRARSSCTPPARTASACSPPPPSTARCRWPCTRS